MSDSQSETSAPLLPRMNWIERAILAATILVCAISVSPNVADVDLWGHVQYGRDLLRDGLPQTTTYSFTAEGYRWINHENLSEIFLAVGADTIGPVGILIAKCLLGLVVVGLMMWHGFRTRATVFPVCLIAIIVGMNLTYHWGARPQLFSYVSFALMLTLLSYCFHGWADHNRLRLQFWKETTDVDDVPEYSPRRMRFLWLAPLLFLFWANAHGGFVAGVCVFIAYLGCRSIEAFSLFGTRALPIVSRWAMMSIAAVLATLINPYGPQLHLWLLDSLAVPRPEIVEWHAPYLLDPIFVPFWLLLALGTLVVGLSGRSKDFTHLTILGIVLWESVHHQRHIAFFAIAFGFWMTSHLDGLLKRLNMFQPSPDATAKMSPKLQVGLVCGLIVTFSLLGYRLYGRLNDMPVKRAEYPVSAFEYMATHNLQGRLVVTYNWAQYALAAFGTEHPQHDGITVAFDGRFRTCYPQDVVDMHFDFIAGHGHERLRYRSPDSHPFDETAVLKHKNPNLVLTNRYQPHSTVVMYQQRDDWSLLYQDAVAQLWGRKSLYDDPQSPSYLPVEERSITNDEQVGSVTWPAIPSPKNRLTTNDARQVAAAPESL